MGRKNNISMAVIRRLPKYHRYLSDLLSTDVDKISSKELGEKIGFSASLIRQDLNCFGDFGQHGYGYNVNELLNEISGILGLSKEYKTIIIGAGNIGQAIAKYIGFQRLSFNLVGIFDVDPKLIGLKIRDVEVMDIDELVGFLKETPIDIGVICVTENNAQLVCNMILANGVKDIWNFAPVDLEVPKDIIVENVHLDESLLTLSYLMNEST